MEAPGIQGPPRNTQHVTRERGPEATSTRRAVPTDAHAIAEVHVQAWRAAYQEHISREHLASLTVERRTAQWDEILAVAPGAGTAVLVAEAEGRVVGFASTCRSRDADADVLVGELAALYLSPDFWGRGVGRALLRASERGLEGAGFRSATLWVLDQNTRARAFYERNGWGYDGLQKADDRGAFVLHEVRYRRDLLELRDVVDAGVTPPPDRVASSGKPPLE